MKENEPGRRKEYPYLIRQDVVARVVFDAGIESVRRIREHRALDEESRQNMREAIMVMRTLGEMYSMGESPQEAERLWGYLILNEARWREIIPYRLRRRTSDLILKQWEKLGKVDEDK